MLNLIQISAIAFGDFEKCHLCRKAINSKSFLLLKQKTVCPAISGRGRLVIVLMMLKFDLHIIHVITCTLFLFICLRGMFLRTGGGSQSS